MAISFSLHAERDEISVVIPELGKALANPRRLLVPLAAVLSRETATIFREQRDPETGASWKPTGSLALSTRPGGGESGQTLMDTGRLRNAFVSRAPRVTADSVVADTAGVIYAGIQNDGGDVLPKRAKMLAIPLTREAKRAGSARRWWAKNERKAPFVIQTSKHSVFIVTAKTTGRGKNKERGLVFHFVLKDFVKMPRRRFIAVSDRLIANTTATAAIVIERIIDEAKLKTKQGGSLAP